LDRLGAVLDPLTVDLDDPAEIFAQSFRLTGRLFRRYPQLSRVLPRSGIDLIQADDVGLAPCCKSSGYPGDEATAICRAPLPALEALAPMAAGDRQPLRRGANRSFADVVRVIRDQSGRAWPPLNASSRWPGGDKKRSAPANRRPRRTVMVPPVTREFA
jgi:hypothetical protein